MKSASKQIFSSVNVAVKGGRGGNSSSRYVIISLSTDIKTQNPATKLLHQSTEINSITNQYW